MVTNYYDNLFIKDTYTLVGPEEAKGNLHSFDLIIKDDYYGEKTFEEAEIKMQRTVINNLCVKNNVDLIVGGDLSNQLGIMNISVKDTNKSFLGIYNACSTFIEGIIIGGNYIKNGNVDNVLVLTSSNREASERQFRFPNEYGSLKKKYTTTTITCGVGAIISKTGKIKVNSSTIGRVVDYGISDAYNMGAIMAPSAANTIYHHLYNTHKKIDDYDLILTGDLGSLGIKILKELLRSDYGIEANNIVDAGSIIYKKEQNMCLGGSGPSVIPLVLFSKVVRSKKIKKVLVVGTGALHNPTMVNQLKTIPAIAHAIDIEVL